MKNIKIIESLMACPANKQNAIKLYYSLTENEKQHIAGNINTHPEILKECSNEPKFAILDYVASNKSTPIEVLKVLAKHTDRWVRDRANKNIYERD